MEYKKEEKQAIEEFRKLRGNNPQISVTIELASCGFWLRGFKKEQQDFKPVRYSDCEVSCIYGKEDVLQKIKEFKLKIKGSREWLNDNKRTTGKRNG